MMQFTSPVAQFRAVLRDLGDVPTYFQVSGKYFGVGNAFGETNLITCPNGCNTQGGFYALTEPREKQQGYVILLYQCSHCNVLFIKSYDLKQLKQYPEKEVQLVIKLVLDVIITGTNGKRIKLDLFTENLL